jgi:hypothetical protein
VAYAAAALVMLVAIAVFAAVHPAAVRAHAGSGEEYRSTVTAIEPPTMPIDVVVKGGDDRLRVRSEGDKPLIIYGYEVDPKTSKLHVPSNEYALITPSGVRVNRNSTAWYLNQERYGTKVPESIPQRPDFRLEVRGVPVFTFHDHRIHWMNRTPPPSVDPENPKPQKVYDWKVPVSYGTTQGYIVGRLDYVGGKAPGLTASQWVVIGALVLMVVVFVLDYRKRRRQRAAAPAGA